MDQPKLCTNPLLNQFTTRNSGLARMESQPKSTTCVELGIDALEQVDVLGADEQREAVDVAVGNRHAGEARRFRLQRVVGTVSLNVTSCGGWCPRGRNTAAK